MTTEELLALKAEIHALPPPARLRLAADLLDRRMGKTALPIIRAVADELALAIMLAGPR